MPRIICLAILLLSLSGLGSVITEVGSLRGFLYGSEPACGYDNWVSHISEGQVSGLNVYAPWEEQNNSFGDYLIPTEAELYLWGLVVEDFLALDLDSAQAKIRHYGFRYQVVNFQDLDSGRNLLMLREFLNDDIDTNGTADPADDEIGSFDHGWGLYLYDPWSSRPIVITAPHPCDDYPTPVFSLEAFYKLDARFLLIAGAGREVAYFPPYNSNNQSISDPSRCANHAFNVFYQHACEQIRGLTDKTEFSLQIHSYDWYKYQGRPNVMLSAGNGRNWPALPLRDNSRARHDLINHTPWLVHPANSLGEHSEVDILDFYCVNQSSSDPVIYLHDGESVTLPYNSDLPGAEFNRQMLFTQQQNLYDVYSPFLHVEMDELPKCYDLETGWWHWFYGYDYETGTWDTSQRYARFTEFFNPWLDALHAVIDSMLILDDGTGPTNPENLRLTSLYGNEAEIGWDRSYSYDFDSYVLNLRWEQDGAWQSRVLDRHTNSELAWQNRKTFSLNLGAGERLYYLSVQARDKHGNHSPRSRELKIWKLGTPITEFTATAGDGVIDLNFAANNSSALGFNIHRAEGNAGPELIASWAWNLGLRPNPEGIYSYQDTLLCNGGIYHYQVSAEYVGDYEAYYWQTQSVSPNPLWSLILSDIDHLQNKTFSFGGNPLALDGSDPLDQYEASGSGQLKLGTFLRPENDYMIFTRDVRAAFDPNAGCKRWDLSCRSQHTGMLLHLAADEALLLAGDDLLLHDVQRDRWHDLRSGAYSWLNTQTGWQNFQLHWGKQPPRVSFNPAPDLFVWQGDELNLHYEVLNRQRVESVDLWLCAEHDSLALGSGLPPQITDWPWLAQELISGARLLVLLHLTDGGTLLQYSSQRFSILPQNIVYQQTPGYSLLSFPQAGSCLPVSEFLGGSATAWIWGADAQWQPQTSLNGTQGFLVRHPQAFQVSLPVQIPTAPISLNLHQGWNLLANPHYHSHQLKNLVFSHDGSQKSYAQMVAENLLTPGAQLHDQAGFRIADAIPPGAAAFVHYISSAPCAVTFDPQYYTGEALNPPPQWSVSLSISDGYNSGDAVQLGTADLSSEAYDPPFDLPKAPAFPDLSYRLALRLPDPQSGATHVLQSEYRGLYPFYNQAEKLWDIQLELSDQRPLRLEWENSCLPQGYSAELALFGQSFTLQQGQAWWIDPPAAGTHFGQIRIRNHDPERPNACKSYQIGIYPNPFRDGLRIDLSAVKTTQLSGAVYNLRGQKVRDLGNLAIGEAALSWDGRDSRGENLPAGIYLLRIKADTGSQTLRLVKY